MNSYYYYYYSYILDKNLFAFLNLHAMASASNDRFLGLNRQYVRSHSIGLARQTKLLKKQPSNINFQHSMPFLIFNSHAALAHGDKLRKATGIAGRSFCIQHGILPKIQAYCCSCRHIVLYVICRTGWMMLWRMHP